MNDMIDEKIYIWLVRATWLQNQGERTQIGYWCCEDAVQHPGQPCAEHPPLSTDEILQAHGLSDAEQIIRFEDIAIGAEIGVSNE